MFVIYVWLYEATYTKQQEWIGGIGTLIYTARALPFENLILAKETTGKCDYFELKFQH